MCVPYWSQFTVLLLSCPEPRLNPRYTGGVLLYLVVLTVTTACRGPSFSSSLSSCTLCCTCSTSPTSRCSFTENQFESARTVENRSFVVVIDQLGFNKNASTSFVRSMAALISLINFHSSIRLSHPSNWFLFHRSVCVTYCCHILLRQLDGVVAVIMSKLAFALDNAESTRWIEDCRVARSTASKQVAENAIYTPERIIPRPLFHRNTDRF